MRAFTAIATSCLCACAMPEPRGELVGAYHIEGALTENTCGNAALPAADPLSFDVEVRNEDGVGLWVRAAPPANLGKLDDDGGFSFKVESFYDVPASERREAEEVIEEDLDRLSNPNAYDEQKNAAPCKLMITETITGTLHKDLRDSQEDAGEPDSSSDEDLEANNVITITPLPGYNCTRIMASAGGPFLALPCRAHYDLVGELSK